MTFLHKLSMALPMVNRVFLYRALPVVLAIIWHVPFAETQERKARLPRILEYVEQQRSPSSPSAARDEAWIGKRRQVRVRLKDLVKDRFIFNLPHRSVEARAVKYHEAQIGDYHILRVEGTLAGRLPGSYSVSVSFGPRDKHGAVFAVLDLHQAKYVLRKSRGDEHELIEVNTAGFPSCAAHAADSGAVEQFDSAQASGSVAVGDTAKISVLFAYSPSARAGAGGTGSILAHIDSAIARANQGYLNSGLNLQVELAGVVETAQDESSDYITNLNRLTSKSDGFYDEVHSLRTQYAADLVTFLVQSQQYCGASWLFNGSSAYGFSVASWGCISNNSVHHEWGHNMGMNHDPENSGGSSGYRAYSYVHRFYGASGTLFRTVMAYAPGSRINYFSTPLRSFDGTPTGVDGARDNVRTGNETGPIIANWFNDPQACSPQGPTLAVSPSSQSALPGVSRSYTLSVKNNDSSACPTTAFSLAAMPQNGLSASLSADSLSVAPGSTGSATLTLSSSGNVADGSYRADIVVSDIDGREPSHSAVMGSAIYTVNTAPPPPVTNLSASLQGKNTVRLVWSAPATEISSYDVYRNGAKIGAVSGTSYSDQNTTSGQTYSYYLIAKKANGLASVPSNTATITLGSTSGGGGGGGSPPKGKKN